MALFRDRRRPYAKWEHLSVAAVLIAGLAVVIINPDGPKHHTASPATSTTTMATEPDSPTTMVSVIDTPPSDPRFVAVPEAADDFEFGALDTSTWAIYDGPGNANVGLRRPSAVTVEGGNLQITARGNVSGGVSQHHGQLYGRWVVRAKMDKGQGYGPAILLWPDSEKWPEDGEIDIAEMPVGDRSQVISTVHYGADNRQLGQTSFGDYSGWHTYAVDWLPDRIIFYIDGKETYRVLDSAAVPTKSMHLAIQNDVGACDSWIGCRNASTPDAVALTVSSVRVFALNNK